MTNTPLVFVSYASTDRQRVLAVVEELESCAVPVWMDCKNLNPGDDWHVTIKKAQARADLVIVFISNNSIGRRGYVQRELKEALDAMKEKLSEDTYIIPVRIDKDAPIPSEIKHLHVADYSGPETSRAIAKAVRLQLDKLGKEVIKKQAELGIEWQERRYTESWDGAPGYSFEFNWYDFHSEKHTRVFEITDIVKGTLTESACVMRICKTEAQNIHVNFGDSEFQRISTWEAFCGEPIVVGNMVSIVYSIHWYGAGAAHPNHGWDTYCFSLEPLTKVSELQELFENPDEAFQVLQEEIRRKLLLEKREREEEEIDEIRDAQNQEWINSGTEDWTSFSAYSLLKDVLRVYFGPYQVGSYAEGSFEIDIPYSVIGKYLKSFYNSSLGLRYRSWDS